MPLSHLKSIVGRIIQDPGLFAKDVYQQFREDFSDEESKLLCRLNAAFLILLTEKEDSVVGEANEFINKLESNSAWETIVQFYRKGLKAIETEFINYAGATPDFAAQLKEVSKQLELLETPVLSENEINLIQKIFCPSCVVDSKQKSVEQLRKKRNVKIETLNPDPITDPVKQILFTSNILVTTPLPGMDIEQFEISDRLKEKLTSVINEPQKYWFDHPIPMGIEIEKNEAIYGMRGLNEMMEFEQKRGNVSEGTKLTCLLSASTTHDGLHAIVKDYFEQTFQTAGGFEHLDLYIFSEEDTDALCDEILIPLAKHYFPGQPFEHLREIFGVDGEYGRHYSFLKAIAAFWQVFIDGDKKATFKIDLDQIFPQEELVDQSGYSALEHFKTDLWGAIGVDSSGRQVELSMIAGALVNQNDIKQGLFTPDVKFTEGQKLNADEMIFFSRLPQAISTVAEMMTRYPLDEADEVIQRVHVTGGTNGILIDALRRYRPFTPTAFGRAEDQAYLLSVFKGHEPGLRYLHKPGLIMRHDKHAFAAEAIAAAAVGKTIGDFIRILLFSRYAQILPRDLDEIKNQTDPFTGAFISPIPQTIVYLRFALKIATLFDQKKTEFASEFQKQGTKRLKYWLEFLFESDQLERQYEMERTAWDLFYDILEQSEKDINHGNQKILEIKKIANNIVKKCKLDLGNGQ